MPWPKVIHPEYATACDNVNKADFGPML